MEKTKPRWSFIIMLTAVLLNNSIVMQTTALSITVEKEECIYEYVFQEGDTISGNFVVIYRDHYWTPEHPGIDFTVTNSGGNQVHTIKGTAGDKFEFKAPSGGMYKFCFHNSFSNPEIVSFHIHAGHIPTQNDLAKDEHLDPVNVKIAELKEALETVTSEQLYLKARDKRHRRTNESTQKRVTFYTIGEYVLLLVASGLQILYIRSLFGKSVGYNRV